MINLDASKTALVLGATGGIGGTVAEKLLARGWHVRALNRNAAKRAVLQPDIDWIQGDAMIADDVTKAARDAELIIHAVNPPGYRNWASLVLPMLDNTIAAAKQNNAIIVLPGTVYNFGPDTFPILRENSPQNPLTAKGAIRVEMERRLRAASVGGTKTIILRAGDFFGTKAANNWFSQGLIKAGKPVESIMYPGRRGVGHQWAYLPDVAETMLRLVERGTELPEFATFHMRGVWDQDGTQMIQAIEMAVGHKLKKRGFPWLMLPLLAPFNVFLRELKEMRYLWAQPLMLDNARLVAFVGSEPHTPLENAVRSTLLGNGCLEGASMAARTVSFSPPVA